MFFFLSLFFVEIWKALANSSPSNRTRLDANLPNFHKITIVLRNLDRVYRIEETRACYREIQPGNIFFSLVNEERETMNAYDV